MIREMHTCLWPKGQTKLGIQLFLSLTSKRARKGPLLSVTGDKFILFLPKLSFNIHKKDNFDISKKGQNVLPMCKFWCPLAGIRQGWYNENGSHFPQNLVTKFPVRGLVSPEFPSRSKMMSPMDQCKQKWSRLICSKTSLLWNPGTALSVQICGRLFLQIAGARSIYSFSWHVRFPRYTFSGQVFRQYKAWLTKLDFHC